MSKLSLGGKRPSRKLIRWVEPSFGGLCGGGSIPAAPSRAESGQSQKGRASSHTSDPTRSKRPRKRKVDPVSLQNPLSSSLGPRSQDEPWVDTHTPSTQAELVVHKKKVEEVENWIKSHVDPKTFKGGAILLLSGPSGCGKSATVRVLTRELGVSLQEWSNTPSLAQYHPDKLTFDPYSRFSGFHGSSQTGLFQEFLLRADKYSRLQMNGEAGPTDRKLILVEDFPNQFYRQPACLHEVLRRFVRTGRTALVFIVSDSQSGDSSSRLLFPRDLQEELSICSISFNPVAPTSMMKVLTRIVTLEAAKSEGKVSVPDRAELELLCSGSSGDVRSAINSLQFSSLTDQPQEAGPWTGQRGRSVTSWGRAVSTATLKKRSISERQDQTIGGKDASLFLFRALGKILYCKRESWEGSDVSLRPGLPHHLAEHHRDRLSVDPEGVLERCHMSGELFHLYLHQNYLDFFSEVEDVARASDYLSHADFLTAEWSSRSTLGAYGSSVATRGLLHANNTPVSARFRPLHKPHWLQVNKKHQENSAAAQSLFISFCMTPVSLQTELLPHLALLSTPLRNQAQISFLESVGRLPLCRGSGRLRLETLTDRDPGELQLDSEEENPVSSTVNPALSSVCGGAGEQDEPSMEVLLPDSQPQPSTSGALLEDDLLIEEYDSE